MAMSLLFLYSLLEALLWDAFVLQVVACVKEVTVSADL